MKRLIAVILFSAVCMTSCSEKEVSQTDSEIESVIATEETTSAEITEITSSAEISKHEIMYTLNETGLDISENGENIQTIQGDVIKQFREAFSRYSDIGRTPESFIIQNDFDFDGYDDLFIPTMLGTPNLPGAYYKYNSETGLFEQWKELNKIGQLMSVKENTLECSVSESAVDHENTVYKWDNNVLKPISKEKQYAIGNSSAVYIDTFEYDESGNENLIKREQLIVSDDGNYERKDVGIKSLYDFEVAENSVNVLLDDKIVQTLECDYPPDKNKLEFYDYDFDGNEDLFVSMENGAMYAPGTYFRYNPDTHLYEKWDELNKIGRELAVDDENENLYWIDNYSEDYRFEKFVYNWKYHKIKFREHIVGYEDDGGLWTETYSIESINKPEKLLKREKIAYDENGNKVGWFNPDDIYFKVNKSGLDVMILGHDDSLQHISGDFYDNLSEFEYAPEYYISESSGDFDSDGFKDLFIPENNMYDSKGIYYRFNPQTFQFEYWEEFNKVGKKMHCGTDVSETGEEFKYYYTLSIENDIRETVKYKWYDDEFLPYQKTVNRVDKEKEKMFVEVYDIDADGNATLVESSERDILLAPKA